MIGTILLGKDIKFTLCTKWLKNLLKEIAMKTFSQMADFSTIMIRKHKK